MPTTPTTPPARRLAMASLDRLAGRLGCLLIPRETFDALMVFKTRAEAAEATLAAQVEADRERELVDGTALIAYVGELLADIPETISYALALLQKNTELVLKNATLERELSTLTAALVADEFPETTD